MLLAGLTGGIASGKSLVAAVLKGQGAHVLDADRIVHELMAPQQEAWLEVKSHFGAAMMLPDSSIDRRKLGELIFSDAQERAWLNACLHPKVFNAFTVQVQHIRARSPQAIIVFDAALLYETGYDRTLEKVIVVYATLEQQIERLAVRDAFTREQALARINCQMPLAEKRGRADYVIDNTGSREAAEYQAVEVFNKLRQDAEKL